MPMRPALHQPLGHGAVARAAAVRERERLALRPSAEERGYDRDWRAARAAHLAEHPICTVEGCGEPATDVDHIESVRDHPERRLDPTNFRSMCHPHHSARTVRDQGMAQAGKSSADAPPRGARHPAWLRRVVVPLTVVCGPPGAGKAAFVEQRRGPEDMVLDLDVIRSKLSRLPIYSAGAVWSDPALRWRNGRLALLDHVRHRWPAAWLIVGEPRASWRQWWVDHVGAFKVVVLETDVRACLDTLDADERRSVMVKRMHGDLVTSWWSRYQRRAGDMIFKDNARPFIVSDANIDDARPPVSG